MVGDLLGVTYLLETASFKVKPIPRKAELTEQMTPVKPWDPEVLSVLHPWTFQSREPMDFFSDSASWSQPSERVPSRDRAV